MAATTMNVASISSMASVRPSLARSSAKASTSSAFVGKRVASITTARPALARRSNVAVRAAASMEGEVEGPIGLWKFMAFKGPGPELVQGRLAMLALLSAAGAEMASHETVVQQFGDWNMAVYSTVAIFFMASVVPYMAGQQRREFGPFTRSAEMLNGRLAMLGFAGLMASEALSGKAFL